MKRLLVFLLFCAPAFATTVTGTIVDSNNNPYANGTASAYSLTASGQPGTSTTPVATNGTGSFTLILAPASYIVTICAPPVVLGPLANTTPPQVCFSSNPITVSGGSMDISTVLNPLAKILGPPGSVVINPAGAVLIAPLPSQNIVQPSGGGLVTPGTSLNVNDFEQVRYADQFQWSQTPAGTISVGANTVTINQTRGISTYSCVSPGVGCAANFGGVGTTHFIRIAGTGTPEAVKITGTTCTNASTGTCTVTFTAVNSHAAGFTLGTATAGFQEALIDSYSLATANPTTGREIACSPWPTSGHFIIYATIFVDGLASSNAPQTFFEGHGCLLEDAVSGGPMLLATGNSYVTFEHFTLATLAGIGRAATGTQVFIRDVGQLFHFAYNHFALSSTGNAGTDVVDRVITVVGDQGATIDHNDFEGIPLNCDTTWCSAMVYGDPTSGAAIGDVHDNYFSNNYDPLLWESGNGLTLKDNVFQNWVHYPWKYRGGLLALSNEGGNYYEGNCALTNPDFGVGAAGQGYSCNTGPQIETSGSQIAYTPAQERNNVAPVHRFSSTGGNIYSYYIVGNDGIGHSTRPLFIGDASTDGVTNFTLKYLKFGAATYDVLRSGPNLSNGQDAAPWGVGNWAVATGVTCSVNPCTFTETFAAPTSYTVNAEFLSVSYTPGAIDYWPVPLFLHGHTGSPTLYIGPYVDGFVTSQPSNFGSYYDAIITSTGGGAGALTGMHILFQTPLGTSGSSNVNTGALILNPDSQANSISTRKGRINMPSLSFHGGSSQTNNCVYQVFDSEANKTFATYGHQPLTVAADTCMGYDTNQLWLAFQGGSNGIRFYVNHLMDSGVSHIFGILPTGLQINKGLAQSAGSGYQAIRTVAGCATAASLAATCTTTVTWTTAFADANYTPHCDGLAITSGVPLNGGITAQVAASVTFQTVSATAAAARFTTIVCSAFHD